MTNDEELTDALLIPQEQREIIRRRMAAHRDDLDDPDLDQYYIRSMKIYVADRGYDVNDMADMFKTDAARLAAVVVKNNAAAFRIPPERMQAFLKPLAEEMSYDRDALTRMLSHRHILVDRDDLLAVPADRETGRRTMSGVNDWEATLAGAPKVSRSRMPAEDPNELPPPATPPPSGRRRRSQSADSAEAAPAEDAGDGGVAAASRRPRRVGRTPAEVGIDPDEVDIAPAALKFALMNNVHLAELVARKSGARIELDEVRAERRAQKRAAPAPAPAEAAAEAPAATDDGAEAPAEAEAEAAEAEASAEGRPLSWRPTAEDNRQDIELVNRLRSEAAGRLAPLLASAMRRTEQTVPAHRRRLLKAGSTLPDVESLVPLTPGLAKEFRGWREAFHTLGWDTPLSVLDDAEVADRDGFEYLEQIESMRRLVSAGGSDSPFRARLAGPILEILDQAEAEARQQGLTSRHRRYADRNLERWRRSGQDRDEDRADAAAAPAPAPAADAEVDVDDRELTNLRELAGDSFGASIEKIRADLYQESRDSAP